ncbi:MAG: Txe/YoeB family addiction module toxin [Candidatus Anammoxibacter sp.]
MNYKLVYTKTAQKDAKKIKNAGLKNKCENLLKLIAKNPYQKPPPFEKLLGNLKGSISRRINIKHRLVYEVVENKKTIKVIRMWTHYE